jgi:serpin B
MELFLTHDADALSQGINRFGLDLFQKLAENMIGETGNHLISPFTITTSLGMLAAGGRGETARQVWQALHAELDAMRLNLAFNQLIEIFDLFCESGQSTLHLANALWPDQQSLILASYARLVREQYRSAITTLDYIRPEKARSTINAWIEDRTNHTIQEMIPPGRLNTAVRMLLTSAVYIKGAWSQVFDPDSTHTGLFCLDDGERYDVPLMVQSGQFNYADLGIAQFIELPMAGGELSMYLLLPQSVSGLAELRDLMNSESLEKWIGQLAPRELELFLPRFEVSSTYQLCPALKELGVTDIFSEQLADLSGMTGIKWLYLSMCLHKVGISVDETGRPEASHAGSESRLKSRADFEAARAESDMPLFRADHPFIYFIRHHSSGLILFIGSLARP